MQMSQFPSAKLLQHEKLAHLVGLIRRSLDDQSKSRQFSIHTQEEWLAIRLIPIRIQIRKSIIKSTLVFQTDLIEDIYGLNSYK